MSEKLVKIEEQLVQVQLPGGYSNKYQVTVRIIFKVLKRVNAALAKALLKGEPSWMMFK